MATLIIMNSAVGFAAAVGQIESDLRWAIREAADIARALEGKKPKRVIVVPQRIVNVVA
jgi:leucyl-tRNA synthetase